MTGPSLLRHYRASRPFHRAVPIRYFATDEVFITRQGAYGLALSLRGLDDECLTPERLETVSLAVITAFRQFDERFRVYQYLVKSGLPEVPSKDRYDRAPAQTAIHERNKFLRDKLSRIELYLVILYEPGFGVRRHSEADQNRSDDIERLLTAARSFQQNLTDLFAPQILKSQDAFRFLRFLLNLDCAIARRVPLKSTQLVDYQPPGIRLRIGASRRSCL